MSIISEFKQRFNAKYTEGRVYSTKTSTYIDFHFFQEKEFMWIHFKGGDFAHAFLEDLGNVVLIRISMLPSGYRFQSREDDILHVCNGVNRNIKFGKVTLNDDYRFDIDIQYFAPKSSFFDTVISCIKDFMDFADDIIQFCEQYGEPTLF